MHKKISKLSHLAVMIMLIILPTLLLFTQGNVPLIRAQNAPSSPPASPPAISLTPTPNQINGSIWMNNKPATLSKIMVGIWKKVGDNSYSFVNKQEFDAQSSPGNNYHTSYSFDNLDSSSIYELHVYACRNTGGTYADCSGRGNPVSCSGYTQGIYCFTSAPGQAHFEIQFPASSITPTPGITTYPTPTTAPSPTVAPTKVPTATPTSVPTILKNIQGSVTIQNGQQVEELSIRLLKKSSDGVYRSYAHQNVRTFGQTQYFTDYNFNRLPVDSDYRIDSYLCKRKSNNNLDCGFKGTVAYCSGTKVAEYCQLTAPGIANFSYVFASPTPTVAPSPTATPTKAPIPTTKPTSTPIPSPTFGTNIVVRASGTVCQGIYPTLVLKIGGTEVKRWNQVGSTLQDYRFSSSYKYNGAVTVHFINDCYRPPEDRNVFVDYINMNGTIIQTESPEVANKAGTGEWMFWNGYISYPSLIIKPSLAPSPTPLNKEPVDPYICERNYSSISTCEVPTNCIRNGGTPSNTYCSAGSFCCVY